MLEQLSEIISRYKSDEMLTPEALLKMQRDLINIQMELTAININAFSNWNGIVYRRGNISVAAAEVQAHEAHPELRETRKLLEVVRSASIAISNELSYNKNG